MIGQNTSRFRRLRCHNSLKSDKTFSNYDNKLMNLSKSNCFKETQGIVCYLPFALLTAPSHTPHASACC